MIYNLITVLHRIGQMPEVVTMEINVFVTYHF